MSNIAGYIDYFRKMAVYHPDIAHDINSEIADSDPAKKKFTRWNVEEVVTGLRSKLGWPALLLEAYETSSSAASVYDVRFRPRGAFTVLDKVKIGDFNDEERAYTLCEKIVRDILKKIWDHHYGKDVDRCATPFKEFRFEGLMITAVGPLFDNQFGYRVEFDFEFRDSISVTSWQDGEDPFTGDDWSSNTW